MKYFTKYFPRIFAAVIAAFILSGCTGIRSEIAGPSYSEPAASAESSVEITDNSSDNSGESPESSTENSTESSSESSGESSSSSAAEPPKLDRYGTYTHKDDVALFLHTYSELPRNFIKKEKAKELGWEGGSLEPYAPGCCIGGDRFGNREGLLPAKVGRIYAECDIDTLGAESRGAKRIVFSSDGLIYYTEDHYASFELLYGEELL